MTKYLVEDGKHLPYTDENGKPDHRLMGAAWAALHGGYRGSKYEGPGKQEAIKKLRSIYKSEDMTPPGEEETKAGHEYYDSDAIECRAAVQLCQIAKNEILFLPTGLHAITPVSGGIGRPIKIKIGLEAASAIEEQRRRLMAKGKRPYFDFNHEDGPASFWPDAFIWRNGEGVIACGEWSRRGRHAVEGKDFRAFSPVFHVDNKRADAARVICNEKADPNMGGLVNNPAFKDLPLWAKNAGATGETTQKEKQIMENEELAALRAKQRELENEVAELKATNANAERLTLAEVEIRAVNAELETERLRADNTRNNEIIMARNKTEAETAVKAAVQRGAILPKDEKTKQDLIRRATADPAFLTVINAMQGGNTSLSTRIAAGVSRTVQVVTEAPSTVFGAMAKVLSDSRKIVGMSARHNEDRLAYARDFNAIYSSEFNGQNRERMLDFPITALADAIAAGDVTDTNFGTLAGTLVTQRTLELLKFMFPSLTSFSTDFSAEPVTFNQTVMTRVIGIPAVVSYNTSTGWADSTPTDTDVPVVMDQHRGVQIGINENILASTVRRLFDELAPAQSYALGKDMVDNLYTRITDANFTNNKVSTLANMNRNTVIDLAVALNLKGVPMGPNMRTLLLYSTYFGALQKDQSIQTGIVQLGAYQEPRIITSPQQGAAFVINVSNFQVYDSPNMPTNNGNVTGFAGSKSALCIVTRVPNDYASVFPGATGGGVVQLVTNPDIGITVMLVQYTDHKLGKASQRIALMYGTAAGQGNAGMLLKAASGSGSSQS